MAYTDKIPTVLKYKLKQKGMPISILCINNPTYAEVFDWLMSLNIDAEVHLSMTRINKDNNVIEKIYDWTIKRPVLDCEIKEKDNYIHREDDRMTWHQAANIVIQRAIKFIK